MPQAASAVRPFFLPKRLEARLKTSFDRFTEAVERRGIELRRSGSEFYAVDLPCAVCGREGAENSREPLDRVRLEPASANWPKGHWFCHHCGAWNDGVDFLTRYCGMPFVDAYRAVTGENPPDRPLHRRRNGTATKTPSQTVGANASFPPAQEARELRIQRNPWPCPSWTAKAAVLCCELDHRVHDFDARRMDEAWQYIEEGRGIRLDVAPVLGVYWNPADRYEDPRLWGLRRGKKLFIPKGIVIALHRRTVAPWEAGPWIVGLLVRRAEPSGESDKLRWVPFRDDGAGPDEPKIRTMVLGSMNAKGCPCIVMESALDAVLVFQECGAEAVVISTNGATYPLDEDAAGMLKAASRSWAWPDADEAGMNAFRRWKKTFPDLELIEMPQDAEGRPWAKDATGLVQERRRRPSCPTVRQILAGAGVVAHG